MPLLSNGFFSAVAQVYLSLETGMVIVLNHATTCIFMKFRYIQIALLLFAFAKANTLQAQLNSSKPLVAKDAAAQSKWVDSVYNSLTQQERIGQLIMVDMYSNKDKAHVDRVKKLVTEQKVGGVIFFQGGPVRQAKLTNEIQALAKTKLLVAMDAEWGLSMRIDSTFSFPWNMTLGATPGTSSAYEVGERIGKHSKRLGVHINFAPVVDINTNPKNPIIGNRSFGEDMFNVAQKSYAYMNGLQGTGVMACAKHFPGHGDTDQDSHKTLPTVKFSAERIDQVELYPYKALFEKGMASVMVAHLNIPSLDNRAGYPSSLSEKVVNDILIKRLGFNGLIFTDALNMKGASNFSKPGDVDLQAFKAGNDVLLFTEDAAKAIAAIDAALKKGEITQERLAHSVKKILMAKYIAGLNNYTPIDHTNLVADLNTYKDENVYEDAIAKSITLLNNKKDLLPLQNLEKRKIAYVSLGDDSGEAFYKELNKYAKVDRLVADKLDVLNSMLKNYNTVIIGFHKSNASPWKSFKATQSELIWMNELSKSHEVILDVFAMPYMLDQLTNTTNYEGLIMSYQNSIMSQQVSAQLIFGARDMVGAVPVSTGAYKVGDGIRFNSIKRLSYGANPASAGLDPSMIAKIDSIAYKTIADMGAPGMQILVARHGKVIMNKNYGYHTYENKEPVENNDIYDIASMTKILATLPLVMQLEEQGELSLDDNLGKLIPDFANSNKNNITLKEMLSHVGRLTPWIPFYKKTLDSITAKPADQFYKNDVSSSFYIPVADRLYTSNIMADSIMTQIKNSDLLPGSGYKYSDLPFYILKDYLEHKKGKDLNQLTQEAFYAPMGMNYMGYQPLMRFGKDRIVPTENDSSFRGQLIHGYVHDQGAAMQGGIGGHAGLFSNANDVAKMMQMYLQGGYYGGKQYIKSETINTFNTCNYCSDGVRRGVGFDKPQLGTAGPTCGCVGMTSFGHSGFTGTYTWADPETEIVYVFLSNRIHPSAENRYLISKDVRTKIQQIIYDSIIDTKQVL